MFIVMTACEKMPSGCWGRYKRVAVVEVEEGYDDYNNRPKMISERARGVKRIVCQWRKQNVGFTEKCAFMRAYQEAYNMVNELNTKTSTEKA